MDRQHIEVNGKSYTLLETSEGKFNLYVEDKHGSLSPARGYNKNGSLVWRTYSSVAEAVENLSRD
jgi:hypothetical protein